MSWIATLQRSFIIAFLAFGLSATASCTYLPGQEPAQEITQDEFSEQDPLEPVNRAFFQFNRGLDFVALRPASVFYRAILPEGARDSVSNALDNLYSPVYFLNSILQGDIDNSIKIFWRFTINSTFGVAGLFDVAADNGHGLVARNTGFGDTLALYGADSGSYLYLPLIGPSNIRDGIGRGVDTASFPLTWFDDDAYPIGYGLARAVDARARNSQLIDDIYATSLDPYATFRSAYIQRRASEVRRLKRNAK